jgi:3-oxoadipate enol-lactonase
MPTAPRIGRVDGLVFEVAGDGPPLLLLHEGVGDRGSWDPHWDALVDRFTAIRYDARGFGGSADPSGSYAMHEDALSVLEAAGHQRAAVMGVSMGGAAAIDLALAHPNAVERLVVVSGQPGGGDVPAVLRERWAEVDRLVGAGDIPAANEIELEIWVDGVGRDPSEVNPAVRAAVGAVNAALLARQATFEHEPVGLDPPARERLGELRGLPLLVVTGEHDQAMVREAATLMAESAGARTVEIAGAAHLPAFERPAEFAAVVLPFLEGGR